MAKYRTGRVNDEIQKVIAAALRDIKDPRVASAFVSITGADVTPDFKYAKIYYSSLRGDKKEVAAGLRSGTGFLRRQLAQNINLRITPELTFIEDESISHGAHISELLHRIETSEPSREPESEENNDK